MEEVNKDKEKLVSFEPSKPPSSSSSAQFNHPLRTQSFNQNHPAFPLPPSQQDYLNTLRNVTKQPPNFVFPKTDVPPPPNGKSLPPPLIPYPNQSSLFNNTNSNKPNYPNNSFNPVVHQRVLPPPSPYQNVQFPPTNHAFNIKMEEGGPPPSSPWWPNSNSQGYQRPDNFQMNYSFGNNMPPFVPSSDFNKPQNNQAGGDMFASPWNNFGRNSFLEASMNFENSGHGLSMRQTMLKESTNLAPITARSNHDNFMQNPTSTPGYSLFNTNTWTPNLVGQLRNTKSHDNQITHLPQHSLFTGQGPQSLAQLLEQQQSQKNDL